MGTFRIQELANIAFLDRDPGSGEGKGEGVLDEWFGSQWMVSFPPPPLSDDL